MPANYPIPSWDYRLSALQSQIRVIMNLKILKEITSNFQKEIKAGLNKKPSSLPFIVHRLSPTPLVKDGELFQVLKIGGSISQNSLVYQDGKKTIIESLEEEHLPIFSTGKAFLAFIKAHLRKNIRVLALNFAYPLKPILNDNRLGGILLFGSKEHAFNGLVGKQVEVEIENYILNKFGKKIIVSLANDTICLTLSGLIKHQADNIAGGIVGTGMNFAFFLDKHKMVNLESANFDKFSQSPEGLTIDSLSIQPKDALFEKEVSGAYLYQHYNLPTEDKLKLSSTHELDKVARGQKEGNQILARNLFKKSAQLISCQIAGIANFKKREMVFIMEGSLFWRGFNYKKTVEKTVKKLTKFRIKFAEIKACGILGAAKLVV